jgi:hypothetical protein
MVFDEQAQWD